MVIYRVTAFIGAGLIISIGGLATLAGSSAIVIADETKRQKSIDFEDEVVEGMNKRPLDSVSQISEKDRHKRKPHLYRKRAGYRDETTQTLSEISYVTGPSSEDSAK